LIKKFVIIFSTLIFFILSCDNGGYTISPNDFIITDHDGNNYQTVQIGDRIWMAENLQVTHYTNGDFIRPGYSNSEWSYLNDTETGAYTIYNDDPIKAEIYGYLYNWYAVDDVRGICPEGWHVPSDDEWMELEISMGMSFDETHNSGWRGTDQGSLLAGNMDLWFAGDLENNPFFGWSGFLALPGGCRNYSDGRYEDIRRYSCFWSSTGSTNGLAWSRNLGHHYSEVFRSDDFKQYGFSVRCIRDYD